MIVMIVMMIVMIGVNGERRAKAGNIISYGGGKNGTTLVYVSSIIYMVYRGTR